MFKTYLFSVVEDIEDIREYLGISYIKSYLNSKGLFCEAKTIYLSQIDDIISNIAPDLIGLSMYCNNQNLIKIFSKKIKEIHKNCKIFVGGPQVMNFEKKILNDNSSIDYVITGEGEETIYELLQCLVCGKNISECNGITYRNNKNIVKNKLRTPLEDLDSLPYPYRELNIYNKKKYFYIMGSRGCLGRCSFCSEYCTGGSNVRFRSPKNIVDEIDLLCNLYGVNKFHFTDPTFEDPEEDGVNRAKEIFNEIIKRKLNIRMVMYTRCNIVTSLDDEYYNLANKAGVECFFLGVESGSNKDLNLYNKKTTVANSTNAIKKIQRHNIYVNFGFINFNPYSDFQTLKENITFLYESGLIFNTYHILSKLTIMPQAPIRYKMQNDGLIKNFTYDSDITEYEFINPEIKLFHSYLKSKLNFEHLIDYDSQINIDYNHLRKKYTEIFDANLSVIFEDIITTWDERSKYLYDFFTKCIDIFVAEGKSKNFESFVTSNNISEYDKKIKNLYFLYLKKLRNLGFNIKALSLI